MTKSSPFRYSFAIRCATAVGAICRWRWNAPQAISDYEIFREFPTEKGFADMGFVPIPGSVFPAIVVELKWDKTAKGAIDQIRRKEYPKKLQRFSREIVLLGINYNKDSAYIQYEVELEGMRREK